MDHRGDQVPAAPRCADDLYRLQRIGLDELGLQVVSQRLTEALPHDPHTV
jgi:hypothetical protein